MLSQENNHLCEVIGHFKLSCIPEHSEGDLRRDEGPLWIPMFMISLLVPPHATLQTRLLQTSEVRLMGNRVGP